MKMKHKILIFLVLQILLYIVAAKILPRGESNEIIWSQWYRPIFVFVPILVAAFFDKIPSLFRKDKVVSEMQDDSHAEEEPEHSSLLNDKTVVPRISDKASSIDIPVSTQREQEPQKKPEYSSISPEEYSAIRENEVARLNKDYDFTTVKGINSIPVPCREVNGDSPTGRVEYYLRGQCFYAHEKAGNEDLAIAALKKAQELMFVSDMIWKRYDFLRLPEYLYKIGKWDEADAELEKIDAFFGKQKSECPPHIRDKFQSAKICETDLMEAHTCAPYCSECAKYANRIYSISGRDKRFPKIPRILTNDPNGHYLSCLSWYPYVEGIYDPPFDCVDIVSYSNRPFRDERSQEEIARYDSWKGKSSKYMSDQERIEQDSLDRAKKYYVDNQTFLWIQENLPDLCPKSLTGFRRIRTQNTKKYQNIVSAAAKLGKEI